jgi:hypothetical protein
VLEKYFYFLLDKYPRKGFNYVLPGYGDGPTHYPKGDTMNTYGSRTIGDTIPGIGVIEQVSLTAYRVGTQWVPFSRVDDMTPVEPLVILT